MITKTYESRDELPAGNGERRGRAYPAFSWLASPVYSEDMPDEIANSG